MHDAHPYSCPTPSLKTVSQMTPAIPHSVPVNGLSMKHQRRQRHTIATRPCSRLEPLIEVYAVPRVDRATRSTEVEDGTSSAWSFSKTIANNVLDAVGVE